MVGSLADKGPSRPETLADDVAVTTSRGFTDAAQRPVRDAHRGRRVTQRVMRYPLVDGPEFVP
jgi:hypothetical protein